MQPCEYTQEIEHRHAATAAVPYSQVAEVIERELGRPPRQAYAWLEERPLASASIGQAHRGRLHDGTEVIDKVRKPGVREDVLADLELMRRAEEHTSELQSRGHLVYRRLLENK